MRKALLATTCLWLSLGVAFAQSETDPSETEEGELLPDEPQRPKKVVTARPDAGVRADTVRFEGRVDAGSKQAAAKTDGGVPVASALVGSTPSGLVLTKVDDVAVAQAFGTWRKAFTARDAKAEAAARQALVALKVQAAATGLEGPAMGLLRAAHERALADDAAWAVELGLAGVALAPELPAAHLALARVYFAVDPTDPGRVMKEGWAAARAAMADPRFARPVLADVVAAALGAIAVLATVVVLVLAARRLRYCLHDLHFFFPRLLARWQSAAIGLLVLLTPVVFRMGLVPSLLLLLAAMCLYLRPVERVVAGVLIASVGVVPVAAGLLAEHTAWNGTRAEDAAVVTRGDLGSSAAVARLQAKATAAQASWVELHALGLNALRQARPQEAIAFFQGALAQRPNDPVVSTNLAVAMVVQGDLENSKALLEAAMRAMPERPEPAHTLGRLLQLRAAMPGNEGRVLELDQANGALGVAKVLAPERAEPPKENRQALQYLWPMGLPNAELAALANDPEARARVQGQVSAFLVGDASGPVAIVYPAVLALLLVLLGFLGGPLDASRPCEKCGRPVSRRGDPEVPEGGTMCTQCVNVYARKGVVPPALKLRKQAEVERRQAFLQRVSQALGLLCGGMGQVFRGQTVLGALVGLVFLFFVGLVVLRSGVVRPEWDGLSPMARVLVAAPFGLLVWAWSWRRLSKPSEGH